MDKTSYKQSRRSFIKLSIMSGATLVASISFIECSQTKKYHQIGETDQVASFSIDAWIKIRSDNSITVMINYSELGQGVSTALSQMIAEELEADWDLIKFEFAPVEDVYKNPKFNTQMTAASSAVAFAWTTMRESGATLRELLILAAAKEWGVKKSACKAEKSFIHHKHSDRSLSYGSLIKAAALLPIPQEVKLKSLSEFNIIGKSLPRLDTEVKISGNAIFGIDVNIPGLLIATILHPPVFGATVKSFQAEKTLNISGVHKVLTIDSGLVVVADNFWLAQQGINSLKIEWDTTDGVQLSSDEIMNRWKKLAEKEGETFFKVGSPDEEINNVGKLIQSVYEVPYQAHATPEPMNATAWVQDHRCDIWAPTQHQDSALEIAARITGLDYENITVNTTFIGGGYGRRIHNDFIEEVVQISSTLKAPVKLIWSREEDIQHGHYHPARYNVIKSFLDDQGLPKTWSHKIVGVDQFAQWLPKSIPTFMGRKYPRFIRSTIGFVAGNFFKNKMSGKTIIRGAGPLLYDIKNLKVDFIYDDPGIPLGHWRSTAHASNVFVVECFLDEVAQASNRDPYEIRYTLLSKEPRHQRVLKLVAEKSDWGKTPAAGIFRGIAFCEFQGTSLAQVAEISIKQSRVRVHRIICVVDCGIVINSGIVKSQIEGGIVFGLTATLKSSITIKKGRVEQSNYHNFPLLRMNEMPEVEVHIIASDNPPSSIGEAGVPLTAPSVVNAVSAAVGHRIRKLPIQLS